MWRNSVNQSSKFLSFSNPKPNPNSLLFLSSNFLRPTTIFAGHGVRGGVSHIQIHSSTGEFHNSLSSLKLGFVKSEGERAVRLASSAAVVDPSVATTEAAVSKASDFVEGVRHYGRCYWELSKAKLSMLVVATSGAGFVLGSGSAVDLAGLFWTCTGTMMVAASASSLNQVFEKNNDALMKRTKQRPLPSGRVSVAHAAAWATTVGLAGTSILACKANILAAGLGVSNLALYAFVYTPLKQIHPVNTWVGAIVGAIPPLLGWAAVSGQVSLNSLILPAALYFWQLPHFMALAYLCRNDYAAGGFRMFSLADPSGKRTSLVALRNCLYLLPLGYLAYDWGLTSGWFCVESTLLTLFMTAGAISFVRDRTARGARRMFHGSLIYLPIFMSGLMLHRLTDNEQTLTEINPGSQQAHKISEDDDTYLVKPRRKASIGIQARPPVAYASVAPFPFLPAPIYADSDL